MLLIDTYLDISPGKGLGLFAKHEIPVGTIYWIRSEIFDKIISPEEMNALDEIAVSYIKRYGFLENNNNWYLCGDNARFSNHSSDSNSSNTFDENGLVINHFASKVIPANEEILCDYTELCATCKNGVTF